MSYENFRNYVMLILGACLIFNTFNSFHETKQFLQNPIRTQGEISGYEIENNSVKHYRYYINFKNNNNIEHEVLTFPTIWPNKDSYAIGEKVEVAYENGKENSARIYSDSGTWDFFYFSIIVIGILIFYPLIDFFLFA